MKVFLDVMTEMNDGIFRLTNPQTFANIRDMLAYLAHTYINIVNLKQLDEEDKEKGDLYFEVYVKKAR